MPRLLVRVLGWASVPFLAVAVLAFAAELLQGLQARWNGPSSLLHPAATAFAGGFALRLLARRLALRWSRHDPFEFIDTLEHELTHALMGYLTLSPPVSLSADLKGGGEVQLKGSNPLAALAPYFLPLWCLLAVALGLIIRPGTQATWDVVVFFLFGAFANRLSREYRWRQTDLHVYGFTFSTCATALALLGVTGLILHARGLLSAAWMAEALPESWNYFQRALGAAWGAFRKGS
jgi:hypothetical protein